MSQGTATALSPRRAPRPQLTDPSDAAQTGVNPVRRDLSRASHRAASVGLRRDTGGINHCDSLEGDLILLLFSFFFFLLGLVALWGNSCRMAEVQFKMTLEMAKGLGSVPSSSIQPCG